MLLSLEEQIETTMSAFGYDLGLIARSGGAGRMANVRKLMRLAREYEANEGRDLGGFLALAADSTRRDEREGMAAVQAEGHDGVRVMTVHAAKGLQFPVVAVPDLGRRLNAGHRSADLVIGRPATARRPALRHAPRLRLASSLGLWELVELNSEEGAAEAQEGCRLVYVAASRARGPAHPQRRLHREGARARRAEPVRHAAAPVAAGTARARMGRWRGTVMLPGPSRSAAGKRSPTPSSRSRSASPTSSAPASCAGSRPHPPSSPMAIAATPPPLLDREPVRRSRRPPLLLRRLAV